LRSLNRRLKASTTSTTKVIKTATVELTNSNALRLLKDLELANIIRVLDKGQKEETTKLSSNLRGAISKERTKELKEQLTQMRNEWELYRDSQSL
jgi:hypothetical protein